MLPITWMKHVYGMAGRRMEGVSGVEHGRQTPAWKAGEGSGAPARAAQGVAASASARVVAAWLVVWRGR